MAVTKHIHSIIESPYITEKTTAAAGNRQYMFVVAKGANKIEIRRAVETLYKVKVKKVNVLTHKGKMKRLRWGQEGRTPAWRKAIVTLHQGQEIKFI